MPVTSILSHSNTVYCKNELSTTILNWCKFGIHCSLINIILVFTSYMYCNNYNNSAMLISDKQRLNEINNNS